MVGTKWFRAHQLNIYIYKIRIYFLKTFFKKFSKFVNFKFWNNNLYYLKAYFYQHLSFVVGLYQGPESRSFQWKKTIVIILHFFIDRSRMKSKPYMYE